MKTFYRNKGYNEAIDDVLSLLTEKGILGTDGTLYKEIRDMKVK